MLQFWWIVVGVVVLLSLGIFFRRPGRKTLRTSRLVQAKRRFHTQREHLEAKFVQLAATAVSPDVPQWADCLFGDDVAYVRNRSTGELSAFVAVALATEELNGPFHNSPEAVGNLQAGTAVFRFDRDHWETDGRAILNLNPSEAIHCFRNDLEIVDEEFAHLT